MRSAPRTSARARRHGERGHPAHGRRDRRRRPVPVRARPRRSLLERAPQRRAAAVDRPGSSRLPARSVPGQLAVEPHDRQDLHARHPGRLRGRLDEHRHARLPDKFDLTASVRSASDTQTLGRKMLTYAGGKTDFLGFDDGTRELPDEVPEAQVVVGRNRPRRSRRRGGADRPRVSERWEPTAPALPNLCLGFSIGDTTTIAGNRLGYLFTLGYRYASLRYDETDHERQAGRRPRWSSPRNAGARGRRGERADRPARHAELRAREGPRPDGGLGADPDRRRQGPPITGIAECRSSRSRQTQLHVHRAPAAVQPAARQARPLSRAARLAAQHGQRASAISPTRAA